MFRVYKALLGLTTLSSSLWLSLGLIIPNCRRNVFFYFIILKCALYECPQIQTFSLNIYHSLLKQSLYISSVFVKHNSFSHWFSSKWVVYSIKPTV